MSPLIVVLSAPSGGGKSSIAKRLREDLEGFDTSISATTRPPRGSEIDGVHYHFLTPEHFEERVTAGEFLEHAIYNGHRYGTLNSEIKRVLTGGNHVLLDIEVVGARLVRRQFPESLLIFVVPPSAAELLTRLKNRGTETDLQISGRLERALVELSAAPEYDYLVVNDDFEETVGQILAIVEAEMHKISRFRGNLPLLEQLKTDIASQLKRLS